MAIDDTKRQTDDVIAHPEISQSTDILSEC